MFMPAADLNQSYQQAVYFTADAPALLVAAMGDAPGVDLANCYSRMSSQGRISVCDGQIRVDPLAAPTPRAAALQSAAHHQPGIEIVAAPQTLREASSLQGWLAALALALLLSWAALDFQRARGSRFAR